MSEDNTHRTRQIFSALQAAGLTMKADKAFARFQMFEEAAEHLDQSVSDEPGELAEIPFVQKRIRSIAEKWFKEGIRLQKIEAGNG